MAYPTDLTPLKLAVRHALTAHTGLPSCLQPGELLTLADERHVRAVRAGEVFGNPLCFVEPPTERVVSPELQHSNRRRRIVTTGIWVWIYQGTQPGSVEHDRADVLAQRYKAAIPAALGYPGNLLTAPDGRETGLDTASMAAADLEIDGPRPRPGAVAILEMHFRFTAGVELSAIT